MPTKIVIDHLAGSRIGQRQEFDPVARLRIGRHPDNDVAFDAHKDLDASTRHAELRHEQGRWVLVDIGSSNGTIVAGQKITRHDVIEGVPVEVEFGVNGPRVRLFIGDPASLVIVPETLVRSGAGPIPHAMAAGTGGGPQPAEAGAASRRPGSRTMAMMVQQAVSDAHDQHGLARSTKFMKSMVDQALHSSTRRFKGMLISVSVVFVAAIAALVVWNLKISQKTSTPPTQLADLGEAGPRIVAQNHDALYLLAFVSADGTENPFCSSFSVAPTWLATNSHCVDRINELRKQGLKVFVVQNGHADKRLELGAVMQHPGYRGGARKQTTDVALVEVSAPMPTQVKLASVEHLTTLNESGVGRSMFIYGFPGRLAKASDPQATLTQGTIGRVTTLDERVGSFSENLLFQHSAFTMEGTSGSPVFDSTGVVIAVNTGSYVREKDLRIYDSETKQFKEKVAVAESLSGYNVAIRIDTVNELMRLRGVTGAP